MRRIFLILISFVLSNLPIIAQCGEEGGTVSFTTQSQLEAISGCEIFQGNLVINSAGISDISALSSLTVVTGSFYLSNTNVTDLSPLSSLNNAQQIVVQGNTLLTICCEILQFIEAAELGSVMNVSISDNGTLCDDIQAVMVNCLGYVEGCTDSVALNYLDIASVDDGSCEYFCPESINDIVDYSCMGESYPIDCEATIINEPSDGAGHYNNPYGLCYDENPPSSGPHRSMWGRWGEYAYMPPQRYIHNLEHGGIAFLYHPCVSRDIIDSLRTLVCSRPNDDGGEFRWILTPYVDLPTNIAVVAWEWTYLNDCFDVSGINEFIDDHYRNAPEDFYYNGSYDTLYTGKCQAYGCSDQNAINFQSIELIDDGSCIYPDIDSQIIILNEGWNIFSTYIDPLNHSMAAVFENIDQQTIIVKNNQGEAYLPSYGTDINLENGQGYQSKVSVNSTLSIYGTQLQPELTPIQLTAGWNIISYLRVDPADITLVMSDIVENIIIVKDGLGNVYFPEWNYSNIDAMSPGEGYQIKLSSADILQYRSNSDSY